MHLSVKWLVFALTSLGLCTINLSFASPAKAAIPCKNGTTNFFSNGSIESCNIFNKVNISVGSFAFSCEQEHFISFDEQANFKECVIYETVEIRRDNAVEICPKKSTVSVLIDSKNQSNNQITCSF